MCDIEMTEPIAVYHSDHKATLLTFTKLTGEVSDLQ